MKIIFVSVVVLTTMSRYDPVLSFAVHPMIFWPSLRSERRCSKRVRFESDYIDSRPYWQIGRIDLLTGGATTWGNNNWKNFDLRLVTWSTGAALISGRNCQVTRWLAVVTDWWHIDLGSYWKIGCIELLTCDAPTWGHDNRRRMDLRS